MKTEIDMSMEVNRHRDSFLVWAILALVSDNEKQPGLFDTVFDRRSGNGNFKLEVEMSFNGVDVDFGYLIKRLEQAFDHQVKQEANKLLDQRVGSLNDVLEQAKQKIREDLQLPTDEERW